ncbi:hypothetical protein [Mongoliitalea daihaiensis]|uniref:hypothetical protein n=1 Tax=Mongoliitalea daihaiensis TaxID=2782006 RepID=UPI001F353175|nr:hypothetical protein [Mongoliitalea daihaiensis]UJP63990.1 hypothetical protein IPZ59_14325 [Mongoliitalea daihaiensis]
MSVNMKACDLFVTARNGNVSDLHNVLQKRYGERTASIMHFPVVELDEFDQWYGNAERDVNGEPILKENSYYENNKGQRWFIGETMKPPMGGEVVFNPYNMYHPGEYTKAHNKWRENLNAKIDGFLASGISIELALETGLLNKMEAAMVSNGIAKRSSPYAMPQSESQADFSFYNETANANMKLEFDQIWNAIPRAIFVDADLKVFEQILSGAIPDQPMPTPGLENPETGEQYTYEEYFMYEVDRYMNEQEFLEDLIIKIADGALDKSSKNYMSDEDLGALWKRMTQKTGSDHKLIRNHYGELYTKVADEMAFRMIEKQLQYHEERNSDYEQAGEKDIWLVDRWTKSLHDFSDSQLVMQRLAHKISYSTGLAEKEAYMVKDRLNTLMTAVANDYWKGNPNRQQGFWKNITNVLFHRVNEHNKPFEWMFERESIPNDPNDPFTGYTQGDFTGRLIQRFHMTDEDAKKIIYEKVGKDHIYSGDKLIQMVENLTPEQKKFFTQKQLKEIKDGIIFIKSIQSQRQKGKTISEAQERSLSGKERVLRRLAVKALVTQADSQEFAKMKHRAANGVPHYANKVALYDYIYTQNLHLMEANDASYSQPADRGFMPQLSMNTYESYHRAGLFPAYLRFMVNLDNTALFGDYNVEYNGETKTWNEWKEYFKDPARTTTEKLKAPFILQDLFKDIQQRIANGKEIDPVHRKQAAASFSISNTMPFRTIAGRSDFSVNAGRIFMVHFESLIFRKHMNPLVPTAQAAKNYYDSKAQKSGRAKDFENVRTFIQDYVDRYMFGFRHGALNNTMFGNMVDQLITSTVLAYLALSPETSLLNLGVGLNESLKSKVAKYGWSSGFKQFGIGLKRMTSGGKLHELSPKAKAFIEYFNIETFSNIDIENQQDYFFGIADKMMYLQSKGEVIIRGTSILGEMTDDQWSSFDVDQNGKLVVLNKSNFPNINQVKEWNYYVSSVQGNYTPEGRRNYHNIVVLKAAMLFKTWMFDYIQERFKPKGTDMYSKVREGYYVTFGKLLFDYKKLIAHYRGQSDLKPYQQENLRKMGYDLMMYSLLAVSSAGIEAGEEDDPALRYIRSLILKFQSQLFLQLYPSEIIGMVSRPFPSMGILEGLTGALINFANLNFEKSGKLAWSTVPGHRVVDFAFDIADLTE